MRHLNGIQLLSIFLENKLMLSEINHIMALSNLRIDVEWNFEFLPHNLTSAEER